MEGTARFSSQAWKGCDTLGGTVPCINLFKLKPNSDVFLVRPSAHDAHWSPRITAHYITYLLLRLRLILRAARRTVDRSTLRDSAGPCVLPLRHLSAARCPPRCIALEASHHRGAIAITALRTDAILLDLQLLVFQHVFGLFYFFTWVVAYPAFEIHNQVTVRSSLLLRVDVHTWTNTQHTYTHTCLWLLLIFVIRSRLASLR